MVLRSSFKNRVTYIQKSTNKELQLPSHDQIFSVTKMMHFYVQHSASKKGDLIRALFTVFENYQKCLTQIFRKETVSILLVMLQTAYIFELSWQKESNFHLQCSFIIARQRIFSKISKTCFVKRTLIITCNSQSISLETISI